MAFCITCPILTSSVKSTSSCSSCALTSTLPAATSLRATPCSSWWASVGETAFQFSRYCPMSANFCSTVLVCCWRAEGRMSRASRRREPSMLSILLHSFGWQRLCWLLGNRFHLASGLLYGRGHFEMVIVSCFTFTITASRGCK